jgi:hypothetical protein
VTALAIVEGFVEAEKAGDSLVAAEVLVVAAVVVVAGVVVVVALFAEELADEWTAEEVFDVVELGFEVAVDYSSSVLHRELNKLSDKAYWHIAVG